MRSSAVALAAALFLNAPAAAQIDDTKRTLLEAGYESGLGNPGPAAPYAFLYLNRPGAAGPGSAWRLALAPVFLDTELGLPGALGGRTDVGLGFSGGGYAFGHAQVDRGDEKIGEAFIGHGLSPSVSLYPRLGDIGPVPVSGVFRLAAVYTDFQRDDGTDAAYEPPPDEWTGVARAGVRAGGVEPGMDRGRAAELSLWAETRVRDRPASYGYGDDRYVRRNVNLLWARVQLSLPAGAARVSGGLNAGSGGQIGRLTAYRLGGMLTQTSEFPLILPGYFAQEISARRFVHAWAQTALPIGHSKRFTIELTAAAASLSPVRGTDPGGVRHAGFASGLGFAPPDGALRAALTYGFAPTALRGKRRGAHSAALVVEIDFAGDQRTVGPRRMTRQQGLRWLLGR